MNTLFRKPRSRYELMEPSEVLDKALRDRALGRASGTTDESQSEFEEARKRLKREMAQLPPPPWYSKYLDKGVDAGVVGQSRVLVAAGTLKHTCQALHILSDNQPRLRFFTRSCPRSSGVPLMPDGSAADGSFRTSPLDGGLVFVSDGRSLVRTAEIVVHEVAHAKQSVIYGDWRLVGASKRRDYERQAAVAAASFVDFLQRCFGIVDAKLCDGAIVKWARQELFGSSRGRPAWTPPESVLL